MKVLAILLSVIYLTSASEVQLADAPEPEWTLIPDGNGNMRIISLTEVFENVPETRFVPDTDVIMTIHTQGNQGGTTVPIGNNAALAASGFNPAHQTRFTIHGWNGGFGSSVNSGGISAHMQHPTLFNVIVVNWAAGAGTANYVTARNRVDDLGNFVGRYINWLNAQTGLSYNNVYVIGHSLGGHGAGVTGKHTNQLVHTVVALDPAGPLFSVADVARRVDAGDAQYVEIIHTNGNLLGFGDPIGHADFYPNGGNSQAGCGIDVAGTCAHERANLFWIESINNSNFWSSPCTTWTGISGGNCPPTGGPTMPMGGQPSNHVRTARGVFFLTTNAAAPFSQGPR
jgi:pancreatic triacylglycerol lipase